MSVSKSNSVWIDRADCAAVPSEIDDEEQDTQPADANANANAVPLAPKQQSSYFSLGSRAFDIAKKNNIFGRHIHDKSA